MLSYFKISKTRIILQNILIKRCRVVLGQERKMPSICVCLFIFYHIKFVICKASLPLILCPSQLSLGAININQNVCCYD